MIEAAIVDLVMERGTPLIDVTAFEGQDYSAATFVMRLRRDRDRGEVLLSLGNAGPTAEGVSATVATTDSIVTSSVRIQINEVTGEGLPYSDPPGSDFVCAYDLDITGGGHGKLRRMKGNLIVKASANG